MMTASPPAAGVTGLRARLSYGLGAAAFGIKDNGFSYLLLIYYNQVLGLPASVVGAAILLALVIDGVIDPLIGHASDRTRSGMGRRHPWMYAAAVPAALAYWALWTPPAAFAADPTALTAWLFGCAVLVRVLIAMSEIPSAAMVGELTDDYDERTRFVGWRYFFGWSGGIAGGVIAFAVFLQPTAAQPTGVLNRAGYAGYGLAAALAMAGFTLASALLTHRYIPMLKAAPALAERYASQFAAVRAALTNGAFLSILVAGLFSAMAAGLAAALNVYINTYFWGLSSDQISALILASLLAAALALVLAGLLSRGRDKKRAAVLTFASTIVIGPLPLLLRLGGLMPVNGAPALMPILFAHAVVLVALFITSSILVTSMLTDTIEANERETGQRSEGLYFGANFFVQKCVTGFGIFASGTIIDAIGFPRGAAPGSLPSGVLDHLVTAYLPVTTGCLLIALTALSRYGVTRAAHESARYARARTLG